MRFLVGVVAGAVLGAAACGPQEFTSEEIENLGIDELRAVAEQGNAAGQVELGGRYRDGLGVEVDEEVISSDEYVHWQRTSPVRPDGSTGYI